jgi:hypothetical protein
MTRKIYKSAMGKTVDMGSLLLQNEQVRAVGNMNVNARGDRLDSNNKVVESKNLQIQRKYNKQTNVSAGPASTSTLSAKQPTQTPPVDNTDIFADLPVDEHMDVTDPVVETVVETLPDPVSESGDPVVQIPQGGLAAAMARSREVKQELLKTPRQQAQTQGVRKI